MKNNKGTIAILASIIFLVAFPVFAHPGHFSQASGFAMGFLHPFSGLDHLLAMLALGYWTSRIGRVWILPASFLLSMISGAFLSSSIAIPLVEWGVIGSAALLSFLALKGWRLGLAAALSVVLFSGFFHGYAHGQEIPAAASLQGFGLGFLLATSLILGMGVGMASLRSGSYKNRSANSNQL